MAAHDILDSHIHLWPASSANAHGHRWMTPGFVLSKQHILSNYFSASSSHPPSGVVYIETDRRLEDPASSPLTTWAAQPIEELLFLRSIVEGEYGHKDSDILKGIVPWAPVHRGQEVFEQWLALAQKTVGKKTWGRVKGFRFLLQAITDRAEFEKLVLSEEFISILKSFHQQDRRFSFDVGVDQRSGGTWQLEVFAQVLEKVYHNVPEEQRTVFILNHMCKPDYTIGAANASSDPDFQRWKRCIQTFASYPTVYMKLSGGFSELSADGAVNTSAPEELADRVAPWVDIVFEAFGPQRIMFGSDWPVCNVKGPEGETSWGVWRRAVEEILRKRKCTEEEKQRVWNGTAIEAYRLNV